MTPGVAPSGPTPPSAPPPPSPRDVVKAYIEKRFQVVFWPSVGDLKGPKTPDWPLHPRTLAEFAAGDRVGILTGVEVAPGRFLHDVDIDWAAGYPIAAAFLPKTEFVYGRASKRVSHCFYTLPEALASCPYKDPVDGATLIEIRGTKEDGTVGFQSMAPPSVWEKDGRREPLEFRLGGRAGPAPDPTHFESSGHFRQRITLAAVGMLVAKHLGRNGFGHDARLSWAGCLLRASIPVEDVVAMGEAMSHVCNNREVVDVRQVVESTAAALAAGTKKVKGGPALAKLIGDAGKKVLARINEWLGRDSDFVRTTDGAIVKDSQQNVRRAVALLGVELSYQEFAEKMLVAEEGRPPRPLDDRTMTNLWLRIDREHRFRPSFAFFEKVIADAAYDNSFHPVRDYLASLAWDGEPRIDSWLATYGRAEDAAPDSQEAQSYLEAVSSIVLVAAVRRILHPGCKYDEMLVLESQQGLNKSSALRALCPRDEWFSDDLPLNVDAKEIIERTLGKWIIEASDLVGGRKADRDHLKSMLSRQVDGPARMAYARIPVERPRQFIIIGTTNGAEYLPDSTGARRFWPVKVGRFDVEGIERDRDQLWAEAVVREAAGASIRLREDLWEAAGEHQEQRRSVDAWEDALALVVDDLEVEAAAASATGRLQVTTDSLWMALGIDVAHRDMSGARRISEIMQRFGFERTRVRGAEKVQVGYVRAGSGERAGPDEGRVSGAKTKSETPF